MKYNQDKQCTHNVTLRRVRCPTIDEVEKQQVLHILGVSVAFGIQRNLWSARLCSIFPRYITKCKLKKKFF